MPVPEPHDVCEVLAVEDAAPYEAFLRSDPSGFLMVPERHGDSEALVLPFHAGDFEKWVRGHRSDVAVSSDRAEGRLIRRANDVWLPLVYLAEDIALPVFLGLVTSYLYDKMKGALRGDRTRVHLSVEYKDARAGVVKRFDFEGDAEALNETLKQFDVDRFLDG